MQGKAKKEALSYIKYGDMKLSVFVSVLQRCFLILLFKEFNIIRSILVANMGGNILHRQSGIAKKYRALFQTRFLDVF